MTPATVSPPPESPPRFTRDGPPPPAPPTRRRGRSPLAVLLVTSALLGGGTTAGILAATGSLGGDTTTTVLQRAAAASSSSTAGGLNAEALYSSAQAGVVDITVDNGSGTGFVVDTQGHIVTAAHVVDGSHSVTVKLADGTTRNATVLGIDNATDVAVLKIDPSGLTLHPLALGSSSSVDVGAPVAVIGDPFGYARSLSTGVVSGVDRTIQAPNGFTVAHAIQTDAAMNPGNSGGPILDSSGKVIGIADQIATGGGSDQGSGVGFLVPIDLVKSSLKTLEAGGTVSHAYLGIGTGDSTSPVAGAAVSQVKSGGPAADAGLRAGDIVTSLGGTTVTDSNDLVAAIATHQPGDKVAVIVRRGSSTKHLTVTLGTQPTQPTQPGGG
jgi:putative serine protease PepD